MCIFLHADGYDDTAILFLINSGLGRELCILKCVHSTLKFFLLQKNIFLFPVSSVGIMSVITCVLYQMLRTCSLPDLGKVFGVAEETEGAVVPNNNLEIEDLEDKADEQSEPEE